ncbi:MAG: IS607 family transposase [Trichodesmium sp. St18_bin1]|jgi:Predicted site-specific integrase-resolvase|nr:IS607 family transposase [Trichodesmium sp. St18_bin1]
MKLSDYAKSLGVCYKTAWNMWKRGELDAYQLPSGTIIVKNNIHSSQCKFVKVAIYCRVSSAENNSNLEFQAERLLNYCSSKGYSVVRVVKEVGSGVNDNRLKLVKLLQENDYDLIVCEHKDRLSRVGFNYLKVLLTQTNRDIEVVNLASEETNDLMEDFVSIITSFCTQLYGLRIRTRKTEEIVKCLNSE